MIQHTDASYGPDSRNRLADATDTSADGARAALESFYYALNQRDEEALRAAWSDHPLAQLNNPLGGILRSGEAVGDLYARIFAAPVRLEVTFTDIVEYLNDDHAVFAGRERGSYTTADGTSTPLEIRTSRYLRRHNGRWAQFHHHGSIDDAGALADYQRAVNR